TAALVVHSCHSPSHRRCDVYSYRSAVVNPVVMTIVETSRVSRYRRVRAIWCSHFVVHPLLRFTYRCFRELVFNPTKHTIFNHAPSAFNEVTCETCHVTEVFSNCTN